MASAEQPADRPPYIVDAERYARLQAGDELPVAPFIVMWRQGVMAWLAFVLGIFVTWAATGFAPSGTPLPWWTALALPAASVGFFLALRQADRARQRSTPPLRLLPGILIGYREFPDNEYDGVIWREVTYAFHTPDGRRLEGRSHDPRPPADIVQPPPPNAPVVVAYTNDRTHRVV
jgi:hypothetical protein